MSSTRKFTWHAGEIEWGEIPAEITVYFHRGCGTPHVRVKDIRYCPRWIELEGRRWVGLSDYVTVTYHAHEE